MNEIHGWRDGYLQDDRFEHAEACDVFEDLVDGVSKGRHFSEAVPSIKATIEFSAEKGGKTYVEVAARVFELLEGYA